MTLKELTELWMLGGPIMLAALAFMIVIDPFGVAYNVALALVPLGF